jgi:hypothetical protein
MSQQAAQVVIAIGLFIGVVVWLAALGLYRKMASAETVRRFEARIPNRQPAEAIKDLIADGRLISPEAQVERPDPHRFNIRQSGIDVRIEAARSSGGSLLVAEIDDAALTRRFLLGLGAFVLILMPLVVGGVCLALWHLAAPSENPGIRGQCFQVAQIVHVLWPPFLIYAAWKRTHTQSANAVSNLLVFAQAGSMAGYRGSQSS